MYIDRSISGVICTWENAHVEHKIETHRGTLVEMVNHPDWGIACYMDHDIQSSTLDKHIYHEALVHPAMAQQVQPKRVMILGGGEGATAHEVLKWPTVERVDMYEWDRDVIDLFKTKYPQWAMGAWDDPRLHVHTEDVMDVIQTIPDMPYDVIIVDLFEPSIDMMVTWRKIMIGLSQWITPAGSVVLYSGALSRFSSRGSVLYPYQRLRALIRSSPLWASRRIIPYHFYLPCFMEEASCLLLATHAPIGLHHQWCGHMNQATWHAYTHFIT